MLGSVLPFSPELVERVSDYCEKTSEALPDVLDKRWEWTIRHCLDAEMMSSKLQGQWMIWMAQWIAPKRTWLLENLTGSKQIVLELGTFTGFSAVAWHEGTRATNAEIVTLDIRGEILEMALEFFKELKVDDRITVVEGPALRTLKEDVKGQFELIFMDADKHNNGKYMNLILDQKLLAPGGIILVDNVLARGFTIGPEFNPYVEPIRRPFWEDAGNALQTVNAGYLADERIDVLTLPLFDGVVQIKWKEGYLKAESKNGTL